MTRVPAVSATLAALVVTLCRLHGQIAPPPALASPETQLPDRQLVEFMRTLRVPMGVELRPAPAPSAIEAVDPWAGLSRATPLSDAMARLLSRHAGYEWMKAGPIVSVRPAGSAARDDGWLDQRVDRFDTADLTMAGTLAAFGRLVDPAFSDARVTARPAADELTRLPAAIRGPTEDAMARRFPVHVERATLRQVLDAIVLAHGEAGWIATNRGEVPVRADSRVTVVFWALGSVAARTGDEPVAPASPGSPGRLPVVMLPVTEERLPSVLAMIGRAAGIPMALVLTRPCAGGGARGFLDLADADAARAVALVLEPCPGYAAAERNGVMVVAPRGDAEADRLLRTRVDTFRTDDMPAVEILRRLAGAVGGRYLPPVREPPLQTPASRESWSRPVTVTIRKSTVGDVLDAIVKAHGGLSWSLRRDRYDNMMLELVGDGWAYGMSATPRR
jgi:hypothetical protein